MKAYKLMEVRKDGTLRTLLKLINIDKYNIK